jgi:branched-chain amino acid transport system ATP-binding protein
MTLLAIDRLQLNYRTGSAALSGVSLTVERGEKVVILGPNGAGKTSLVRSIAGFLSHERVQSKGSVTLRDRQILGSDPATIARLGVCYVPEQKKVFRSLTVTENLALMVSGRERRRGGLQQHLDRSIALFPALARLKDKHAGLLSGGEQQMVALARAMTSEPELLIVDEPCLGLAPIVIDEVMRTLTSLSETAGVTVLIVDQNIHATAGFADKAYTLNSGVLSEPYGPAELRERLQQFGYSAATS